MYSTRKIMLIKSFVLLNLLMATAKNIPAQKIIKSQFSLMNIPDNLPVEDLQEGLRVLTTDELKTLSQYIDSQSQRQSEGFQSKRQTEQSAKNLLGAMENYWKRHARAAISKKKRSIDDLYEEVAHDYAEQQIKNANNEDFSEMEALGCTCRNVPSNWNSMNMRTKRDNKYTINLEKGYSIEEYVRDLENSFPRDQDEKEQYEGETVHKSHLRIKRLRD